MYINTSNNSLNDKQTSDKHNSNLKQNSMKFYNSFKFMACEVNSISNWTGTYISIK